MVSVGCEVGGIVVVVVVVDGWVVTVGMGTPVVVTVGGASVTGTVVVGTVVVVVVGGIVDVVGVSHVVVVSGIEVVEDVVDGGSPGDCVVVGNSARVVVEDTLGGSDVVTSVVVVGSVCNPL